MEHTAASTLDEAFVEEVAGNPCRRDVLSWRRLAMPARIDVHRVEGDPPAGRHLDLRHDGGPPRSSTVNPSSIPTGRRTST